MATSINNNKNVSLSGLSNFLIILLILLIPSSLKSAPGDILYENYFASNGDVNGDWTRLSGSGNDFQASNSTYNSSPRSLRIRDGSGGTSDNNLIDASSAASAEVSFWLRQGSPGDAPESGEDLELYYSNNSNNWVLLATYLGSDAAGTVYNETITLPANALHNNLRFRFDMTGGSNSDRWYVDDFVVTETGATGPLTPTIDYHFDQCSYDGSSGEVVDSGSGGNHATAQANASTDPNDAVLCQSAIFSGSGDYLATNQELSDLRGTSSLSFWIKTTQTGNDTAWMAPGIAGIEEAGGTDDIFWGWLDANGRIGLTVGNDNATKSSTSINNGSWHHVVLTRNASSGAYAIYIDRNLDASGTLAAGTIGNTFSSIGRIDDTGGTPNYFIGNLDELKIYDQALSLSQIQEIYDNESSGDNYDGSSRNCPVCQSGFTCDDFEGGLNNWTVSNNGGDAGINGATFNSASNSLYTRWGDVTVTSSIVSTDTFNQVEVKAWVRRGDDSFSENPESGEELVLSYLNASNSWVVLETFAGGSTQGEIFDRTYTLPASAIHSNFRLRIQQTDGDGSDWDYWHVDDVCIEDVPLPAVDHIEISHDGNALTCSAETLTIRACADASCTTVVATDVDVTLFATGGTSTWSNNPITIPGNSSSGVNVSLTHRTAETITLSASALPAASNALVCSPVGCNITFSGAGFLLSLPNHNSCSTANLSIQAVRLSDTGTSCAPAYTGNQSVNFSFNYLSPASGSILPVLDSSNMAAATVVQNRTVNFDGTASATLDFEYQDAGQLSVTVADGGSNGLTAATVNTIVTPAKLNIYTTDTNNACTGPDYGNCTAFKVAGIPGNAASEFNLVVEGACADDTVTPNFQLNNIVLSSNLVAPTLASGATANGANGSLGVTTVNITSGGTATVTETLSEVGAFSITATPPNYLGQPIPAATSSTIGRFIPDRFIVSDNSPLFDDATCNFTYQDQTFGFASGLTPELTLTAVNSAGATTANYGGDGVSNNDFWKLDASVLSGRTYSNQVTAFPGSLNSILGSITVTDETDYDGINTFIFPLDTLTYNKADVVPDPAGGPTSDAPFGATATLNLSALLLTDDDGVFYDQDNNGSADAFISSDITGTDIRWGRWFIANAFGSELQALPMVAEAQYYDGSNFVINTDDTSSSCSTFTAVTTAMGNYSGNLSSGETTLPSPIPDIVDGLVALTLSAPGNGNDGSLLMMLTSPAWMQYDYDGDSTAENASGTATFGIFEGRQPVIIQRQSY